MEHPMFICNRVPEKVHPINSSYRKATRKCHKQFIILRCFWPSAFIRLVAYSRILGCVFYHDWGNSVVQLFKSRMALAALRSVPWDPDCSAACGSAQGTVLEWDKAPLVHPHLLLLFYLFPW